MPHVIGTKTESGIEFMAPVSAMYVQGLRLSDKEFTTFVLEAEIEM